MRKKIFNVLLQGKQVVLTTVFLGICTDILFLKKSSDLRIFALLGVYIASIIIYKLSSRFTFILGLLVLVIMYVEFLLTGASENTEKAAVWLFFLMGTGLVQQFKE